MSGSEETARSNLTIKSSFLFHMMMLNMKIVLDSEENAFTLYDDGFYGIILLREIE